MVTQNITVMHIANFSHEDYGPEWETWCGEKATPGTAFFDIQEALTCQDSWVVLCPQCVEIIRERLLTARWGGE